MLYYTYMKFPTRRLEHKLRKQGYALIAGVDEVGRGALAGPIVAASVILPKGFKARGITDSKKLSPTKREELYLYITKNAHQWAVAILDNAAIDRVGIQEANAHVLRKAVQNLNITPDYVLIDGRNITPHPIPHDYIVKGDSISTSIAAASIIAKVTRDHIMNQLHEELPQYGFNTHVGYGTLAHTRALHEHGRSRYHRTTFSIPSL